MILLELMKSSEVRKAGDQSNDIIIRVWIKLENQWTSDTSEKNGQQIEPEHKKIVQKVLDKSHR